MRVQLVLRGSNNPVLDPVGKGAGAVGVQRKRAAVLVGQGQAVHIGREECLEKRRQRGLLGRHDALVGHADEATVRRTLVLGAMPVVVAAEQPLVGGISVLKVVDGTIAACGKDVVTLVAGTNGLQVQLVFRHVSRGAGKRGEGATCTCAVGHDALDVARDHVGVVAQPANGRLVVHDERRRTTHLLARCLAYRSAHAALEELRGHLARRASAHARAHHHIAMLERTEDGVGAAAVRIEARLVGWPRHVAAYRVGHEDGHLVKRKAQGAPALIVSHGHKQVELLDGVERLRAVRKPLPGAVGHGPSVQCAGLGLVRPRVKAQLVGHGRSNQSFRAN